MKKLLTSLLFLLPILTLLPSCSASDPSNGGYSIDPGVKIALIVICSIICAVILGYNLFIVFKKRRQNRNKDK